MDILPSWIILTICMCVCLPASARNVEFPDQPKSSKPLVSFSPPSIYIESKIFSETRPVENGRQNVHGPHNAKVRVSRQAVANKTRIWPGGVVPYVLDMAYSQEVRDKIVRSMREIEQSVGTEDYPCVKYVPRSTEVNYLDVRLGNGCISAIGLDYTGPQVSTFSLECAQKGSLMHELLHTLGLYHEMDRTDRDSYLDFNATNLRDDAERNFVLKNSSEIDLLGTPYDFTSIMHYGPYSFGKDLRYPAMTPKPQFARGVWMGQRYALSELDVLRVQRLYHCLEDTSHILSDISPENRLAWCDFGDGICNLTASVNSSEVAGESGQSQGSGDSRCLWTTTSRTTPDGPFAGNTNGLDAFFYASKEYCELVKMDSSNGTTSTSNTAGKAATTSSTVSLKTPILVTNTNDTCMDYRIIQSGPTSHLELYVMGPLFARVRLLTLEGVKKSNWATVRQSLTLPPGLQFQLEFVAVLQEGSVAIDDLHILKGECQ